MNQGLSSKNHGLGILDVGLLIVTVIVLCGQVSDTVLVLPGELSSLIHMVDTCACVIFFMEFCFRLYRAESKLAYLKWGWIDLIASVPNIQALRWGRMVRVLRIIRLLRGFRSVQKVALLVFQHKAKGGAGAVLLTAVLLVTFSSASILVCEQQSPDANIKTAEEALWWSVSTLATVGYGDRYPVTTEGRVIAMVLMVAGVGMFGAVSGLAAWVFVGAPEGNTYELREVTERLTRVEANLEELLRLQRTAGTRSKEEKQAGSLVN